MVKIQIKSIFGKVLFEHEKENNTVKETLREALKKNADLRGAYLRGADLGGAYLRGAYLRGAYLRDADLGGADLRGAYLRGAYLRDADLRGADLRGADLRGADLGGADLGEWGKINNSADILIVGNIGSRNDITTMFHTNKGIFVKCGCFNGTLDEFVNKVKETHKGNIHERNYLALVEFTKIKFEYKNENGIRN